ncbi:MAG TPA: hypothetical protein VEB39_09960 [Sphingomicrobium sp.]|nr:hypothetical protein [Sphingomicrobium sp.]
MTAIDAERAFAADAQKLGQWTAFRKWATPDAIMFVPQAGSAHEFLKDKSDPPVAVFWWPGRSYVSCDGNTAINTGPWVRQWGKSVGYFTTVWQRQVDGSWKWLLDHGDVLKSARAEGGDIKPEQAACSKLPVPPVPQREVPQDVKYGGGSSKDGTLSWSWTVMPDGSRRVWASIWDGRRHKVVLSDQVAAE